MAAKRSLLESAEKRQQLIEIAFQVRHIGNQLARAVERCNDLKLDRIDFVVSELKRRLDSMSTLAVDVQSKKSLSTVDGLLSASINCRANLLSRCVPKTVENYLQSGQGDFGYGSAFEKLLDLPDVYVSVLEIGYLIRKNSTTAIGSQVFSISQSEDFASLMSLLPDRSHYLLKQVCKKLMFEKLMFNEGANYALRKLPRREEIMKITDQGMVLGEWLGFGRA